MGFRAFLFLVVALAGCRGTGELYCGQLDGKFYTNDDCDVRWSECTDGVVREIRCTFADPRYECQCFEDGETDEAVQISDDMCDTVDGQDRDAVRAASNAMCSFNLQPINEFGQ